MSEDRLKALGAAAASSGEVALVHVTGSTPEASTLPEALQHRGPVRVVEITPPTIRTARDALTTGGQGRLVGATVNGRILVMPSGRGSSSSSSVLAEAIRLGTAPLAILVEEPDEILVLGAIVADYLYARTCPVLALAEATRLIATDDHVRITRQGTVTIIPSDR